MRKAIPKSIRKQVYAKYNGHCAYCGCEIPEKGFNVDHLYCLRNYEYTEEFTGIDVHSIDNLMPACGSCNRYKKSGMTMIVIMKSRYRQEEEIIEM